MSPEGSRGSLGGSWGGPVALLEGSWGVRGRFRSRLFGYEILSRFFDPKKEAPGRQREAPGRHFGGIWGAKTDKKSIQNRDGNSRAKKEALERDLASIRELPKR